MLHFQKHTLKNGVRVITSPMHDTKAVTVLILVGVGSRYENDDQAGLSHFLEHMFFKGTKKRPTAQAIARELDQMGASFNAFTAEEVTGFYVRAASDRFPTILDILADMLFNGTFPDKEVERERHVIVEEINMYNDMPQSKVEDLLRQVVFGASPLGRSITGLKETVLKATRQDFINYKTRHYTARNLIVVAAGNPNHYDWHQAIARIFSSLPKRMVANYQPASLDSAGPKVGLETRKTDQAHLILALPTFPRTDERRPIAQVMAGLLGGMMSSRLFVEVREKRGLAYYVNAGLDEFHDTGLLYLRAGVQVKKILPAVQVMVNELKKLRLKKITREELNRVQENIKGSFYIGLEDSMSVAQFLGNQELFWQKIEQPEEIVEKILSVSADQVRQLAEELFTTNRLHLAVVGPYNKKQQDQLIKLLGLGVG